MSNSNQLPKHTLEDARDGKISFTEDPQLSILAKVLTMLLVMEGCRPSITAKVEELCQVIYQNGMAKGALLTVEKFKQMRAIREAQAAIANVSTDPSKLN